MRGKVEKKAGLRCGTPDDDSDDIEGFAVSARSVMTDERYDVEGPVGGATWRWTWSTKHRLVTNAWSLEGSRCRRSDGNAQLHCAPKVAPTVAPLCHSSGTPGRRSRGSPFLGYRLETETDRGRNRWFWLPSTLRLFSNSGLLFSGKVIIMRVYFVYYFSLSRQPDLASLIHNKGLYHRLIFMVSTAHFPMFPVHYACSCV